MALNDIGRISTAQNLHLSENLATDGGIAVSMDDFESVSSGGAFVADFVDGATVAVAEDLELVEVGGGDGGGGGGRGGGGGGREGEREAGTAVGEVGEAEV